MRRNSLLFTISMAVLLIVAFIAPIFVEDYYYHKKANANIVNSFYTADSEPVDLLLIDDLVNHGDEEEYTGLRDLVADGINGLRAEKGLEPYSINLSFNKITDERVKELPVLFNHERPNGIRGKYMIPTLGKGTWRGEIIAKVESEENLSDEDMAKTIVQAWKESPKHYEAIIADHYDEMGVGVYSFYDEQTEKYFTYSVAFFRNGIEMMTEKI